MGTVNGELKLLQNRSKNRFFDFVNARSSKTKIGTNLSIDKSIKIGKSDLIDIDCIDQSVEIDDTLVSFIDLSRKIHLFFCSSKNEN